jgi:hypothetical protein
VLRFNREATPRVEDKIMSNPIFRLAVSEDAALVQTIRAEAYLPVYQAVIGAVPKPAIED